MSRKKCLKERGFVQRKVKGSANCLQGDDVGRGMRMIKVSRQCRHELSHHWYYWQMKKVMTCHSCGIVELVLVLLLLQLQLLVYVPFWHNEVHRHYTVYVHHPDHGAIRESRSYYKHGIVPEKELVSVHRYSMSV